MRIWIVNYYTGTPDNQTHPRYVEFARFFMDAGHEVITINSSLTSNTQEEQTTSGKMLLERTYGDFKFIHVNAPAYQGNGVKRMYSIWKFASLLKKVAHNYPEPDVILHNIHPPFDYPVVKMAKKMGTKYIAEAWDLWPEFFVTLGLVGRNNPFMKVAYAIEKQYYYNASEIIFTFLGSFDYLKRQGWMKEQNGKIDQTHLHYINNGIDLAQFENDKLAYPRKDEDMNDPDLIKVVYLGSVNKANNIKSLVDAAALLQNMSKYRFFIYGDGADRLELEQYVKDNNISNVVFKETRIPYEECAWVVSQATVNVMNYEKGFGQFGVSSGKMFHYLAAGKPIVCNIDIAYDNIIKDNNLGVCCDLETAEEIAFAIKSLIEQPRASFDAMCERVRETAKRFDYKVLAAEELKVIES